jgi:beta-lactam-binding protein with PASTA domain
VPPSATPTSAPSVKVPDIRGQNTKDAKKTLEALGLRLGEQRERCEDIDARDESRRKLKKDQIRCQSPAPDADAAPNTAVLYVLSGGGEGDD